jgi:hypothetical protein
MIETTFIPAPSPVQPAKLPFESLNTSWRHHTEKVVDGRNEACGAVAENASDDKMARWIACQELRSTPGWKPRGIHVLRQLRQGYFFD